MVALGGTLGVVFGVSWAPRAVRTAQNRPKRPQERPKTANIGPERGPKTTCRGPQHHILPSVENIAEKVHRKNMLPVNLAHEYQKTR